MNFFLFHNPPQGDMREVVMFRKNRDKWKALFGPIWVRGSVTAITKGGKMKSERHTFTPSLRSIARESNSQHYTKSLEA